MMSDCGVCITGEADETAYDIDDQNILAPKDHRCCECNKKIVEGTQCARAILYMGQDEHGNPDDPTTYWTCLICDEIASAFFCGDRVWGGQLWESFDYAFENLNTSCFDKLTTPEAKTELRRRWMQWKGLIQ